VAEIGRQAPEVRLPMLGSKKKVLAGLENYMGQPLLINFFASWCEPCIAEHSFLMETAKSRHIPVIGIAYKDKTLKALEFLERYGNPYQRVLTDEDGQAGIEWGISGVPETFLVDPRGIIVARNIGPLTPEAWKAAFDAPLAKASQIAEGRTKIEIQIRTHGGVEGPTAIPPDPAE
jgi:cytochrome c biogenesis protein CcmG/thiol:disulfide interchange protein DsbE